MKNCWICKHRNGDDKGRCGYCASVYDDTGDYLEFEIDEELAQAMTGG